MMSASHNIETQNGEEGENSSDRDNIINKFGGSFATAFGFVHPIVAKYFCIENFSSKWMLTSSMQSHLMS